MSKSSLNLSLLKFVIEKVQVNGSGNQSNIHIPITLAEQVFPSPVSHRRNEEYSFLLRPPPGGRGGGYSQLWSSIRTAKPVGKSRVRLFFGGGGLAAFPPAPLPRSLLLSFLPFRLCSLLPRPSPSSKKVGGWAPCAVVLWVVWAL